MKIAITGAAGTVGRRVVAHALECGHQIVATDVRGPIDSKDSLATCDPQRYTFIQADLKNFDKVVDVLKGCDAVIHLAALIFPTYNTHNDNVVVSWNVMEAAAQLGILRVAQASSINVIGLYFNHSPILLDYLPLDEAHPRRPDDSYSVSKVICEIQADSIARRYPQMRIASLRLHMVSPSRDRPVNMAPVGARKQLWGYTLESSAARAFLLAVTVSKTSFQTGHESFFIVEPDVASDETIEVLLEEWKDVPVKADINVKGFFDCGKAERLLGWKGQRDL
ncbi:hypothetical protein BU17DRAFT_35443 [Hysterangium stoloniferum]|nr:hypothetical protein BU17DRAFT_35443 [Hysterangium stoloniferum]